MSVPRRLERIRRRVYSVPIFWKVLGIGALVAVVFGGVTVWRVRSSLSDKLLRGLEDNAMFAARTVAAEVERPLLTDDAFAVQERLGTYAVMMPSLRYIIVRNAAGATVAHTFERAVPPDLDRVFREGRPEPLRVLATSDDRILDVTLPILKGHVGSVQMGVSERMVSTELQEVTRRLAQTLLACAGLGAALALALTYLLTEPIHRLVGVADRLREGDFETRAEVDTGDEIGRLALAFNQLAQSLERYRAEVREKERSRAALIQKIIQAQEEERKTISQELHDHLGQSLLALLLVIQSGRTKGELPASLADEMDAKLRQLIDEIRRLVQGMRPPVLDDYGLEQALRRLVADVSDHTPLSIDYQYMGSPNAGRLPEAVELTLYRIAQEAVTNVVRHSHAPRASVVVLQRSDRATLLVEDQGRGFDKEALGDPARDRLGLSGMRERAELLGGRCVIDSEPGRGTTVRVEIPLAE